MRKGVRVNRTVRCDDRGGTTVHLCEADVHHEDGGLKDVKTQDLLDHVGVGGNDIEANHQERDDDQIVVVDEAAHESCSAST